MRNILIIAIEDPWPDKPQEFSFHYGFPRTGLHIASCVEHWGRSHGFQARLLFLDHELQRLQANPATYGEACFEIARSAISQWHPALVCIAAPYTRLASLAWLIATHCKALSRAPVITGGPHFGHHAQRTLARRNNPFDAIVEGAGETKLQHIIENLTDLDLAFDYPGIITCPDRPDTKDEAQMGDPPPLRFDLLPREVVAGHGVVVLGGRGCMFDCNFCVEASYWGSHAQFTAGYVSSELQVLSREYQNPAVGLGDSLINLRKPEIRHWLSEALGSDSCLSDHFFILSRAELLDHQGCAAFKEHGGKAVWVGVESGSQELLRRMGKSLNLQALPRQLNIAKDCGLNVGAFFMFGYPGETSRTANDTLNLIERLHRDELLDYLDPSVFVPYPGLPMFLEPERFHIRPFCGAWNEEDWSGWGRYNAPPVFDLDTLSRQEIYAFWRRAYELKLEIDIRDRARPRRLEECRHV